MAFGRVFLLLGVPLLAMLGFASSAHAVCGITGSATAAPVSYDPFNPAGLATTTVVLTLARVNTAKGEKTNIVHFFLRSTDNIADGTIITPISIGGGVSAQGFGRNIFYNFSAPSPIIGPTNTILPSNANRFFRIEFTGNNTDSDTATVTFTISLPANLDLNTSIQLPFDAIFACSTTGGGQPGQQSGQIIGALVFPVTVLSALQAHYVGTALDFGEVGNKTTANVLAAPATYTTPLSNHVSVRSSGPYNVTLTSDNDYQLRLPVLPSMVDPQLGKMNYKVLFLGQTITTGLSFTAVTCSRAGVPTASADPLSIRATLLEGGDGKLVSPTYQDLLTVTVSPLAVGAPSQQNCPAL